MADTHSFLFDLIFKSNTAGITQAEKSLSIAQRRLISLQQFAGGLVLTRIGTGLETAGKKIFDFANDAKDAAIEFNRGMTLVNTQAHLSIKEFGDLQNRTLSLGRTIPQSLGEVNDSLYDLFSSVDIAGNRAKTAVKDLELFSHAATAGQAPLRDTSRAVIAMANAFGMAPTAENFSKILDIQFRLVEKGVGTYDEFSKALGDVLPSSKAAGQSLETMSAALAFATRRGLTASKAGLSVARSFDLLARPEVAAKLKKLFGVETVDKATGKFRDFNDVIIELGQKLGGLTQPARVAALQEIFGKQRPAAIRFIKQAVENYGQLSDMQGDIIDNQGSMNRAFKQMSDTSAVKLQVAMNNFRVAMVKFGAVIIPIATKVIGYFSSFFDWLNRLSPQTRKWVVIIGLLSGAFLVLTGTLFKVAGGFMLFQSMLTLMGTAAGGAQLTIGMLAMNTFRLLGAIGLIVGVLVVLVVLWKKNRAAAIALAGGIVLVTTVLTGMRAAAATTGASTLALAGAFGPLSAAIAIATLGLVGWQKAAENARQDHDKTAQSIKDKVIPALMQGDSLMKAFIDNTVVYGHKYAGIFGGGGQAAVQRAVDMFNRGAASSSEVLDAIAREAGMSKEQMLGMVNAQYQSTFAAAAQEKNLYQVGKTFNDLNRFMRISHQHMQLSIADFVRMAKAEGLTGVQTRSAMAQATGLDRTLRSLHLSASQVDKVLEVAGNRRMLIKTLQDMGVKGEYLHEVLKAIARDKYAIQLSIQTNIKVQIANVKEQIAAIRKVMAALMALSDDDPTAQKRMSQQILKLNALEAALAGLESASKSAAGAVKSVGSGGGGGGGGASKAAKEIEKFSSTAKIALADVSRAFRRLGANMSMSLAQGMTSPNALAALDANIALVQGVIGDKFNDLYTQISKASKAHKLDPGYLKMADKVRKDGSVLLRSLQTLRDQMAAMQQSILEGFNKTSLVAEFSGKPAMGSDVLAFYNQKIAQAKQWGDLLKQLAAAGLNRNVLQQLASAGPDSIGLAKAILTAGVAKVNAFEAQLQGLATSTVASVGSTLFGSQFSALSKQAAAFGVEVDKFIKGLKADALRHSANGVLNALGSLVSGIKRLYTNLVSGLRSAGFRLPGLAYGGITMPRAGGVVRRLAEAGVPEATIPLNRRGAAFLARSLQKSWPHTQMQSQPQGTTNHFHLEVKKEDLRTALAEMDWAFRNRGD